VRGAKSAIYDCLVLLSVKEAVSENEKIRQVVSRQKSIMSEESLLIKQLRHDLAATRSSLSQLRAARKCRDIDNEQLIDSLRLQLHAVSTCLPHLKSLPISYKSSML